MKKLGAEQKFQKWLNTRPRTSTGFIVLDTQIQLYKAYDLLKNQTDILLDTDKPERKGRIGIIDVIFRYKNREYVGEAKYTPFTNYEFWDALKVAGYTAYYKWQEQTTGYFPAIIMPKQKIKLEHRITANYLKVSIFGITQIKGGYTVEEVVIN